MRSHGYHFWVIKSYISPSEAASEKNAVFSRTEKKITSSFFFLSFKPKKGKAESVLQILTQALMVKFSLIWFFTFFLHMKGALNNFKVFVVFASVPLKEILYQLQRISSSLAMFQWLFAQTTVQKLKTNLSTDTLTCIRVNLGLGWSIVRIQYANGSISSKKNRFYVIETNIYIALEHRDRFAYVVAFLINPLNYMGYLVPFLHNLSTFFTDHSWGEAVLTK